MERKAIMARESASLCDTGTVTVASKENLIKEALRIGVRRSMLLDVEP